VPGIRDLLTIPKLTAVERTEHGSPGPLIAPSESAPPLNEMNEGLTAAWLRSNDRAYYVRVLTHFKHRSGTQLTESPRWPQMRAVPAPAGREIHRGKLMKPSHILVSLLSAGTLLTASLDANAVTVISTGGDYAPDCSGAAASQGVIWPPNHSMVAENIVGVTDPFGLATTITITAIQQDEPLEATGSGNTEPDGNGVGTSTAYVRAERAGLGTGRLYFISFSAMDSTGAQCTGVVQAYVPHDQGQGFVPTDTGQRYDSTQVVD